MMSCLSRRVRKGLEEFLVRKLSSNTNKDTNKKLSPHESLSKMRSESSERRPVRHEGSEPYQVSPP